MKNINISVEKTSESDSQPAFSYREINTVLAGLRQIQEMLEDDPNTVLNLPYFGDCDPLTVEEIEEFCERLITEFPSQPE